MGKRALADGAGAIDDSQTSMLAFMKRSRPPVIEDADAASLVGSETASAMLGAVMDADEFDEHYGDAGHGSSSSIARSHIAHMPDAPHTHVSCPLSMSSLIANARPLCMKCGDEVDVFKAQIKCKGTLKYICNGCNSRMVLLSRKMNGMPAEFRALSDDDQQEFWKAAAGTKNIDQLKAAFVDTLVRKRTDKIVVSIQGQYLPLGVYQSQGYDCAMIENRCTDK